MNDCLIHSVNFALRCPWFVAREQVVKLMASNSKKSLEKVQNQKVRGGPTPQQFRNFAIVD